MRNMSSGTPCIQCLSRRVLPKGATTTNSCWRQCCFVVWKAELASLAPLYTHGLDPRAYEEVAFSSGMLFKCPPAKKVIAYFLLHA